MTGVAILRTPDVDKTADLAQALERDGMAVQRMSSDELAITGGTVERIGDAAFDRRMRVHSLSVMPATLEEGYLRLVEEQFEFRNATGPAGVPAEVGGVER